MATNKIICKCTGTRFADIRRAMIKGARTVEDIFQMTGAGNSCKKCHNKIEAVLAIACGCFDVTVFDVVEAVQNGATTFEEVALQTRAGSACKVCHSLIEDILARGE